MTEEEEMAADAVMIADLQIIAACGLSYCLSAVADAAMAVADTAMTVACGSSYYSSAVADLEMAAADVATVTTAGLLSYCFCYAETMAVDVAADNHFLLAGGSFPLPLYILQDYNFVLIIQAA